MAKQTSNNGPSQAASTKAVTFSRQSAQRIAKVVRTVEAGNRDQPGSGLIIRSRGGPKFLGCALLPAHGPLTFKKSSRF